MAALAGVALVSLVLSNRPDRPTNRPAAAGGVDEAPDPVLAYVKHATALSDSLFDQTERLMAWMSNASDTTGFFLEASRHDGLVRAALENLEAGSGHIARQDFELLVGLFLEYLDAVEIGNADPATWAERAAAYGERLRQSRSEVEPALLRYLGLF